MRTHHKPFLPGRTLCGAVFLPSTRDSAVPPRRLGTSRAGRGGDFQRCVAIVVPVRHVANDESKEPWYVALPVDLHCRGHYLYPSAMTKGFRLFSIDFKLTVYATDI